MSNAFSVAVGEARRMREETAGHRFVRTGVSKIKKTTKNIESARVFRDFHFRVLDEDFFVELEDVKSFVSFVISGLRNILTGASADYEFDIPGHDAYVRVARSGSQSLKIDLIYSGEVVASRNMTDTLVYEDVEGMHKAVSELH